MHLDFLTLQFLKYTAKGILYKWAYCKGLVMMMMMQTTTRRMMEHGTYNMKIAF